MPYSKLKTFVTVVELGGVNPASKALGRTPSAVSQQLKSLQEELGVQLLSYRGGRWILTPQGSRMHHIAREMLNGLDAQIQELKGATKLSGQLRVGIERGLVGQRVQLRLLALRNQNPGLQIEVYVVSRSALHAQMQSRTLELCLMLGQALHGYRGFRVVAEPVSVVVRQNCDWRSMPRLSLRECAPELDGALGAALASLHVPTSAAERCDLSLNVDGIDTARQLVVDGLALAGLPLCSIRDELASGQLREVTRCRSTVPLIWSAPTVQRFGTAFPRVQEFLAQDLGAAP